MNIEATYLFAAIIVGLGATVVVDLWTVFLKHALSIPSLSYCLVGRWILCMPKGQFAHASISTAPPQRSECMAGWIAHYVIGAAFALMFVVLGSEAWLARPTLLPALAFGIGTALFPFLIMQPAFGLGIAASRTPKPLQARLKSIATHAVFGIGLYASAVGMSHVLSFSTSNLPPGGRHGSTSSAQIDECCACWCDRLTRHRSHRGEG